MRGQTCRVVAVIAFVLTGSVAAAQSVGERLPRSLRHASALRLPSQMFDIPPQADRTPSASLEVAQGATLSRARTASKAQIRRGSATGKTANLVLAAFVGGLAGFYLGGFISPAISCGCRDAGFDVTVGAPIGAVVGGVLAATYVHRRQRS